jgi:hypothetical protein
MFVRAVAVIVLAIGTGTIASSAQAADLCNNGNVDGTLNNPAKDFTPCSFSSSAHITKIVTYHWNDGRGAAPGTITLRDARTGEQYGPFSVRATSGQGGAPNVYWTADVDITVPAGDYRVIDSDVHTWSWNSASGDNGIVIISGEFADDDGDNADDSDDGDNSDNSDNSDDGGR